MSNVAAFVSFQDSWINIPRDEGLPVNDAHFQFNLPGLSGPGVLFFRFRALDDSTFSFRINGSPALSHSIEKSSTRSFHELFPMSVLSESGNQLTILVQEGKMAFSDIVFMYHSSG